MKVACPVWWGLHQDRFLRKKYGVMILPNQNKEDVHVWGVYYGDKEKQWKQKELEKLLNEMWKVAAPEAYKNIPVNRDTYEMLGHEDDAMLLTQELYDALLNEYEGQEDSEHHADLEYQPVSPEMVGKKWLVVVDYHT